MALKKIAGKSVRKAPRIAWKKARTRAKPKSLSPEAERMARSFAFG